MSHKIKRTPTGDFFGATIYGDVHRIDDLLDEKLTLGHGAKRDEFHWKNREVTFYQFLERLTQHKVSKSKDGPCFTQGKIIGERRKSAAMERLDLLVLDMDTGQSIDSVRERLIEEDIFAFIYTTHSHEATSTSVSKANFFKKMGMDSDDSVTDKLGAIYLETFKRYTRDVAQSARFVKEEHTPEGIQLFFSHVPMEKYRIVMLLDEPFVFAKEGLRAIDKWKKKYAGVADLLDAFYDQSCVDPARLFYFPTHGEGANFRTELIIGEPLRLDEIEDGNPRAAPKLSDATGNAYLDSLTEEDLLDDDQYVFENDWVRAFHTKNYKRFAAADMLRDFGDVRNENSYSVTVKCPFDDDHSNAGDDNDQGFRGSNSGEWSVNGVEQESDFMGCSHDSCRHRRTVHFLDRFVTEYNLERADLLDYVFDLEGDDEEDDDDDSASGDPVSAAASTDAPSKAKKEKPLPWEDQDVPAEMQAVLNKIARLKPFGEIDELLEEIYDGGFDAVQRATMFKGIAQQVQSTAAEVQKKFAHVLGERSAKATAEQDKEAGITPVYTDDHFDDQVKAVVDAFKRLSKKKGLALFKTTDGKLARVSAVQGTGTARLDILDRSQLFVALTDVVRFYRQLGNGKRVQVAVPTDILTYFSGLDADRIPLPIIERVVKHPIFTSEGRLVTKSGYDRETSAYIDIPFELLPVNESPSDDELDHAYDLIFNEVFVDFPFQDGDDMKGRASKANLLAMLMQPFIRDLIGTAATPMYVVNKPVAGAGSGKLLDCVSLIQTGDSVQTSQFVRNDEENAKVITSRLKADPASILFFDNVAHKVNSASLASAITSGFYSARILGESNEIKVKMQGIWAMSGIAMSFSTEIARRVAPITLIPAEARPEDRQDFKHKDILNWVAEHRAELVWAVCTMIQAWVDEDMPTWSRPPIGSFERWSSLMGGILEVNGMKHLMANSDDFRRDTSFEADSDLEFISYLFNDSVTTLGKIWTSGEVFEGLWVDDNGGGFDELDLPKVNTKNRHGARVSLGGYIKGLLNRKFELIDKEGQKRVIYINRRGRDSNSNVLAYCLEEVL
jgi:hypothetical protein